MKIWRYSPSKYAMMKVIGWECMMPTPPWSRYHMKLIIVDSDLDGMKGKLSSCMDNVMRTIINYGNLGRSRWSKIFLQWDAGAWGIEGRSGSANKELYMFRSAFGDFQEMCSLLIWWGLKKKKCEWVRWSWWRYETGPLAVVCQLYIWKYDVPSDSCSTKPWILKYLLVLTA